MAVPSTRWATCDDSASPRAGRELLVLSASRPAPLQDSGSRSLVKSMLGGPADSGRHILVRRWGKRG
jgi:hypothetical protein